LVEAPAAPTPILRAFNLLTRPRFAFGTMCIFLYVGGEVAIGSLIVSYLMQPSVLGITGGFGREARLPLLGRRHGGAVHWRLAVAALSRRQGIACRSGDRHRAIDGLGEYVGNVSGWSLLAIGLFNSIMFPTIFHSGQRRLGQARRGRVRGDLRGHRRRRRRALRNGQRGDLWGLKNALIVRGLLLHHPRLGWFARRPLAAKPL